MKNIYGITTKGQMTIPKKLRDAVGITDKSRLRIERQGNDLVIKQVKTLAEVSAELQADLKRRGFNRTVSDEEMSRARQVYHERGLQWM